ncbi:MJ0042-type zinc finger domain-containing protein [Rickettsia endosymbiont of Oedothorax gibbosus]|uniref:MJ0042-type zinc finger domain-containing protein n=1 Tax=Rickettsia endosymbiont of Oedothorax gibbosus TaxID=931099 RepID=UPI002024910A|nr:MJ0042-type zinc finger domain-containing protein [Rickettsia endosymbiont of Oedothorax gibbosus]
MSISCPSCNTNFIVSKEQIGMTGRKVKCSQCNHIWYQQAALDEQQPSIISNHHTAKNASTNENNKIFLTKGANLPALLPPKTPQHSNILPILLFSVIILLLLLLFQEKLNIPALYKENDNILTIGNIHVEQNKEIGQIKVSYQITNNSDHDVTIPLIRVRLLDKKYVTVKSYIMHHKNIKLLPKQHIDIATNLDVVPRSSELLNIMLGNGLDLILH